MDYSLYFVGVKKGTKTNPYQYDGPNDHPDWVSWINKMLFNPEQIDLENRQFIDRSDNMVDFINEFLNYHFSKYKGNPDQFMLCLNTIKQKIKLLIEKGMPQAKDLWGPKYELYAPIIDKWIKENEEKLKVKRGTKDDSGKFELKRIKNIELVKVLCEKRFLDKSEENKLLQWFKGVPIKEPIVIKKPANHFISIIADLQESHHINKTKEYCYNYIHNNFIFPDGKAKTGYIKRVMKPKDRLRIRKTDKSNFVNISDFVTS